MVAFYRVGLFLATLSFMAGVALLLASFRESGAGLLIAVIIVLGSMSLIRGLRRRLFAPEFMPAPPGGGFPRHAAGRHR